MNGRAVSLSIAASLIGILPHPTAARSWPTTAGWEIFEGDAFCGMRQEYEGKGDTELLIGKMLNGDAVVRIGNFGWSARTDVKYDLVFHVGKDVFSGGTSIGTDSDGGRKGFSTKFDPSFFRSLAAGTTLRIYLGNTLVDNLSLAGSAAAVTVIDRCLSSKHAIATAAQREKQRFSDIPDDPFANAKVPAGGATPLYDPAQWLTPDDYPPAALRANAEGRTTVALTINTLGRVTKCAVTRSSGNADLDAASCRSLTLRARFKPATDDRGAEIESVQERSINWTIPVEPSPEPVPSSG